MKSFPLVIIILLLSSSCLSHISSRIGQVVGYPLDIIEENKPISKRICSINDPSLRKYPELSYRKKYGKIGALVGFLGDLLLSIYYGR
ncbi:MAG: hypothetical protein SFU98_16775 [Leptospiraceae bacterium]|nr:hypothetical protein [Leptospiraceae bacterium]